jgi:hypothetical protein
MQSFLGILPCLIGILQSLPASPTTLHRVQQLVAAIHTACRACGNFPAGKISAVVQKLAERLRDLAAVAAAALEAAGRSAAQLPSDVAKSAGRTGSDTQRMVQQMLPRRQGDGIKGSDGGEEAPRITVTLTVLTTQHAQQASGAQLTGHMQALNLNGTPDQPPRVAVKFTVGLPALAPAPSTQESQSPVKEPAQAAAAAAAVAAAAADALWVEVAGSVDAVLHLLARKDAMPATASVIAALRVWLALMQRQPATTAIADFGATLFATPSGPPGARLATLRYIGNADVLRELVALYLQAVGAEEVGCLLEEVHLPVSQLADGKEEAAAVVIFDFNLLKAMLPRLPGQALLSALDKVSSLALPKGEMRSLAVAHLTTLLCVSTNTCLMGMDVFSICFIGCLEPQE